MARFLDSIKVWFMRFFGSTIGYILYLIVFAAYSLILIGSGYYLIKKYKRREPPRPKKGAGPPKRRKMFEDMRGQQYIGVFLIILGCLPLFFKIIEGLLFTAGTKIGSDITTPEDL